VRAKEIFRGAETQFSLVRELSYEAFVRCFEGVLDVGHKT